MLFEDQIEQSKEYFDNLSSRVQESSLFNQLHDKYTSLSPSMQKILLVTAGFLAVYIVLIGPIASYQESVENMVSFEERKSLTQKVIDYSKKSKSTTPQPKPYDIGSISSEIKKIGKSYSINYLPEQTSVASAPSDKKFVTGAEQSNYLIKANKSNIDQATTLAYSIQKLNKSLLITALEFKANREDPAYFDASIEVANLYVRSAKEFLPKPEPEKKKRKKRGGRR